MRKGLTGLELCAGAAAKTIRSTSMSATTTALK